MIVVDACAGSQEEAYFVSGNSSDFGKGGALRPELAQEARERLGQDADMLRYCPRIAVLTRQLGAASAQSPGEDETAAAGQVTAAVEAALADDDVPFEFMSAIPHVALKVVGSFRGEQDLRFERLQAKAEAYQVAGDAWACARGRWQGRTTLWVCWKPELGLPVTGRDVVLSFTINAAIVMQLDGSGAIAAAEVTDRGCRRRVTGCGAAQRFPSRDQIAETGIRFSETKYLTEYLFCTLHVTRRLPSNARLWLENEI